MKPHEIITHYASKVGIPPSIANNMADTAISKGMKDIQHDNTLMFYKLIDNQSCFIHFVTADSPLKFVSSISYFLNMLKENNINTIYLNTRDKEDVTALSSAGVNLEKSDNPTYPLMGRLM
jgi:hypothetical protein